ncbi:MAG TPA: tRNA (adenosine(37)-N6)-threonylcarbamoyltransferase complex transferase subunit TsaD [Deltaproteobacteria bacterium]|nr:tRNA (adenosine(37)-N6)-threonylcarbamoyltransferase complex transferase subunit TsaD [Deltaproteobacteria bacterium]
MLVLGIESSCDDTAAAVVEDGARLLSSVVSSQDDIHGRYGGVVPELASRRHIETVIPVVEEALSRAGLSLEEIDAIGVTRGPGLVGSILVGLSFAKAIAYVSGKPFVGVNHIEAHSMAAFIDGGEGGQAPCFPLVALIVSGGHTTLLEYTSHCDYRVLGQTRDDAAGEAFDKAAKLLGLGFPGGAAIDRAAGGGDASAVPFKRPMLEDKKNLDFSFSGIKTAVLNHISGLGRPPAPSETADIAASFQEAVVDVLVEKAFRALGATGSDTLIVAGGVACNSRLRARLAERAASGRVRLFIPPPRLCSDNAAMVAAAAYHMLKNGRRDPLSLNALPSWKSF